jgi:ubiquinone biosynthesis protein
MIISASLLAAALVLNAAQTAVLPVSLFGSQSISITAALGLLGYVIATILGIWLIISIYRSGKL